MRTEPPGLPVRENGKDLAGDAVHFAAGGPFGVLVAARGCREAKHRLEPADAGREIVLVLDPARAEVIVDPGVAGAALAVNGQNVGAAPATVDLDLCRDNTISVSAAGFKAAAATIQAKATPLEARTAASALRLEALPTGRLVIPAPRVSAAFFVDGKPAAYGSAGIELPAGSHEVRATNEEHFIDVTTTVEVPAGGTASPRFVLPPFARLVVQTFPPNCRVALKKAGGAWREVGESPIRYEVAAGRYTLRVEAPSGPSREQEVDLAPGVNAPVRISFGRPGR